MVGDMEDPIAWLTFLRVLSETSWPTTSPSFLTPKKSVPWPCLLRIDAIDSIPSRSSPVERLCSTYSVSGP